jgi:predicted GNAT family acetyltransferase
MDLQITHSARDNAGEFTIERNGKRVGRLDYARDGLRVEILHTEVDPSLRGEGAGGKLVARAVEWARAEDLQIVPVCPYAKAVFAKTPDYGDVLSPR